MLSRAGQGNVRELATLCLSLLGKVTVEPTQDSIDKELKGRNIIRATQPRFMEYGSCQINLISFF